LSSPVMVNKSKGKWGSSLCLQNMLNAFKIFPLSGLWYSSEKTSESCFGCLGIAPALLEACPEKVINAILNMWVKLLECLGDWHSLLCQRCFWYSVSESTRSRSTLKTCSVSFWYNIHLYITHKCAGNQALTSHLHVRQQKNACNVPDRYCSFLRAFRHTVHIPLPSIAPLCNHGLYNSRTFHL
jgi:hypothetical protein